MAPVHALGQFWVVYSRIVGGVSSPIGLLYVTIIFWLDCSRSCMGIIYSLLDRTTVIRMTWLASDRYFPSPVIQARAAAPDLVFLVNAFIIIFVVLFGIWKLKYVLRWEK